MTHSLTALPATSDVPATLRQRELVLDIEQVSKRYCRDLRQSLWYGARDMFGEMVGARKGLDSLRPGEFWAVHNVSMQLRSGEALGLVGRNGAGKTTLLRMIAGIIRPDTGRIAVRGRVAPLISLGAGFKPILTGRENIYVNLSMLGLNRAEIEQRYESVVSFADIGDALNAPVQTYSKGMKARLGFACAVNVDPDVFIIDEALSVGDLQFRTKCYRKLAELRERGISMIVVSHNAHMVTAICDRAAYLRRGELIATGDPFDIVDRYKREVENAADQPALLDMREAQGWIRLTRPPREASQSPGADIMSVSLVPSAADRETVCSGQPARVTVRFRCHRPCVEVNLWVAFKRHGENNKPVVSLQSRESSAPTSFAPGDHELQIELPPCCLGGGQYVMKTYLEEKKLSVLDAVDWTEMPFVVDAPSTMVNCEFFQPRNWEHRSLDQPNSLRRSA